jgi:hypothetical protein
MVILRAEAPRTQDILFVFIRPGSIPASLLSGSAGNVACPRKITQGPVPVRGAKSP